MRRSAETGEGVEEKSGTASDQMKQKIGKTQSWLCDGWKRERGKKGTRWMSVNTTKLSGFYT